MSQFLESYPFELANALPTQTKKVPDFFQAMGMIRLQAKAEPQNACFAFWQISQACSNALLQFLVGYQYIRLGCLVVFHHIFEPSPIIRHRLVELDNDLLRPLERFNLFLGPT